MTLWQKRRSEGLCGYCGKFQSRLSCCAFCREIVNETRRKWLTKDVKARLYARKKEAYARNPEHLRAKFRQYYQEAREKELARKKAFHMANRERENARARAYYRANSAMLLARQKAKRERRLKKAA